MTLHTKVNSLTVKRVVMSLEFIGLNQLLLSNLENINAFSVCNFCFSDEFFIRKAIRRRQTPPYV